MVALLVREFRFACGHKRIRATLPFAALLQVLAKWDAEVCFGKGLRR